MALAGGDHGAGVIGLKFEGAATDVGGIDDPGLYAEILRNAKPPDALIAAGVIDGIDIAPTQAGVFEGLRGGLSFDLQRTYAWSHPQGVLVDPNDGGVCSLRHMRLLSEWEHIDAESAATLAHGPTRGQRQGAR